MFYQRFKSNTQGAAAIEFGLFAPIIVFSLLMMSDLGLATFDRIKLTGGVRSAGQYILNGADTQSDIAGVVKAASGLRSGVPVSVNVTEYCACPDSVSTATACTTVCSGNKVTHSYIKISASATSQQILNTWTLTSEAAVRQR